jgi:hypothetical protein
MPIEVIDLTTPPGSMVQRCAACGSARTIQFNRGAIETAAAPFTFGSGANLLIKVDGAPSPTSIGFAEGTFTATEARDKLASELSGVVVGAVEDRVIIESASTGDSSSVTIVGGSALAVLGLDRLVPDHGRRPTLGVHDESFADPNAMPLRPCGCGALETLVRTWDTVPSVLHGSMFDRHRRAVNALAHHFVNEGWVHAGVAAAVRSEHSPDTTSLQPDQRLELT